MEVLLQLSPVAMFHLRTPFFHGMFCLLAAAGLGLATGSRAADNVAGGPTDDLTVVSAIWGADVHILDVTVRVAALLQPQAEPFVVNQNSLQGKSSPTDNPGQELVLTYRYRGVTKNIPIAENLLLSHQILEQYATAGALSPPGADGQQALTEEQLGGLVHVQSGKGLATGFITRIHDMDCVVTSLHMLADQQPPILRNQAGQVVETQGLIGAVGADLALLRLTQPLGRPPAFVPAAQVLQAAKIGDQVVVAGYRAGTALPIQINGRINGFGLTFIEVNAAFESGNSGSPIYDVSSKQVVGVATSYEVATAAPPGRTAGSATARRRDPTWFGIRLDAVTKWETIDLGKWRDQLKRLSDFHDASLALEAIARSDLTTAGKDLRLRSMIQAYHARVAPAQLDFASDYKTEQLHFMIRSALAYAEEGAAEFAHGEFYDYFHRSLDAADNVNAQANNRERLVQVLKDLDGHLQNYNPR